VIILIASVVILHSRLESILTNSLFKHIESKFRKIESGFISFQNRLNEISHYHELLPEFYNLFNILFPERTWLFYIFEESEFRIINYDTSKSEEGLPEEINLSINKSEKDIISVSDLRGYNLSDTDFNTEIYLNHGLDTLILIRGKSQTVALLFAKKSNLGFLDDPKIVELANSTLLRAGQILENTLLYLNVIQKNLEIKNLFEVSEKLLTSFDTEEILDFLLDALAEVIPFDAAVIFLFDPESKKLYRNVSKGYEEGLDLTLKLGQGASGWVAETRKISLIKDVSKAEHYFPVRPETRSQVSIPLEIQNELMGVLSLESNDLGHFTNHSIELLTIFANQAVIALYNAKQYEISLTKQKLEHELVNAGKVQKVLLPQHAPVYNDLNISFVHIPSKIVSGDLFDLAQIDNNTLGLIIGDVSGKGAGAAIMMSLVLAGFRAYKKSRLAVCEIVANLNNLLEESVSEGRYATLFYALLSTADNTLTYTNAGHNPPLIFRADGTVEKLSGGGIVIGFLANQVYRQTATPFSNGDLLLTYTDGITETLNLKEEEFGEQRLISLVKKNFHLNSYELKNKILDEVNQFAKSDIVSDDRTLVIVKYQKS
jgi:serine phosphatase RsbU (regulator of sigma subunit)